MKKLFLLLIGMAVLSGCGLKMVNKEKALNAVDSAYNELEKAREEGCSQSVTDKIDGAKNYLNGLIKLFD